jgi:alkanesulfonate monooxygenase SsuD/methylene tetrahydromethanopterin reductase-like flavin-dependent oxidoreductase (luciferase family)
MRVAFKTSPQYTSWGDLRAFWSAADEIEVFEWGWLFDHFYAIPQPGRDSRERRTLRTAARFADHWNYLGLPPEGFAGKRDVLYEHCATVGRDPGEITLSSHM